MSGDRAARVEQAIVRERGLPQATAETRREAFLFLAMLDAAFAHDADYNMRNVYRTLEEWGKTQDGKT